MPNLGPSSCDSSCCDARSRYRLGGRGCTAWSQPPVYFLISMDTDRLGDGDPGNLALATQVLGNVVHASPRQIDASVTHSGWRSPLIFGLMNADLVLHRTEPWRKCLRDSVADASTARSSHASAGADIMLDACQLACAVRI